VSPGWPSAHGGDGNGSDTFRFESLTDRLDTITDFLTGLGGDVLNVADLLIGFTAGSDASGAKIRVRVYLWSVGLGLKPVKERRSLAAAEIGDRAARRRLALGPQPCRPSRDERAEAPA
jgi:hypothetical protein